MEKLKTVGVAILTIALLCFLVYMGAVIGQIMTGGI